MSNPGTAGQNRAAALLRGETVSPFAGPFSIGLGLSADDSGLTQSRVTPDVSCEIVLTRDQWITLYVLINKSLNIPDRPPSLGQAIAWIGQLGGHIGRKRDGQPGLKTVWLGYQRVCDAEKLYTVLKQTKFG